MCSHYSKYESVLGSLPVWVLSVMNTTSEGHYWRRASRIAGEKLGKSSSPKATIKLDKIVSEIWGSRQPQSALISSKTSLEV